MSVDVDIPLYAREKKKLRRLGKKTVLLLINPTRGFFFYYETRWAFINIVSSIDGFGAFANHIFANCRASKFDRVALARKDTLF